MRCSPTLTGVTQADLQLAGSPRSTRSRADDFACFVLRIPERRTGTDATAQRLFSTSMTLSALRCLLSYVVFPVLTPVLGTAAGVGPAIGIPIAVLALFFDVRGIRSFWLAEHRWRWPVSGIYLAVMVLVTVLLVGDIAHLA